MRFSNVKNKKKYLSITIFIIISTIVINAVIQVLMLTVQTISNDILNSTKFSLLTFEGYDKTSKPFPYRIEDIEKIDHIKFVTESRPLFLTITDTSEDQNGCQVYAIDSQYSYYIGIPHMEDNHIYFPQETFKDASKITIVDQLGVNVKTTNFPGNAPMILYNNCFISKKTYNEIVKNLPDIFLEYVQPIYIIGVDQVKNVFGVVKDLNELVPDDNPLILYQANGLQGLVNDSNRLLVVMIVLFVIFILFNTTIIIYLSSLLINSMVRDLMVLYLNGLSRKEISKSVFSYIQKRIAKSVAIASAVSTLLYIIGYRIIIKQNIDLLTVGILITINVLVILLNRITFKTVILKMVSKRTSNNNISKIVRN
jgi:hypothetical protein